MKNVNIFYYFIIVFFVFQPTYAQVHIEQDLQKIKLENAKLTISFSPKTGGIVSARIANGKEMIKNKAQLSDLTVNGKHLNATSWNVIRKKEDFCELIFIYKKENAFRIELHYILSKEQTGIYCYLYEKHQAGWNDITYPRISYKLSGKEDITEKSVEDFRHDTIFKETNMNFSATAGKHEGIFLIQPSLEYIDGNPYNDNLNTKGPGIILSGRNKNKITDTIKTQWSRMCGPFFIYFCRYGNLQQMHNMSYREINRQIHDWPYKWMQHPEFPSEETRGEITGILKNANGKPLADNYVLLDHPETGNKNSKLSSYHYFTKTDSLGKFKIAHVRPGFYALYNMEDNMKTKIALRKNIQVISGITLLLGPMETNNLSKETTGKISNTHDLGNFSSDQSN